MRLQVISLPKQAPLHLMYSNCLYCHTSAIADYRLNSDNGIQVDVCGKPYELRVAENIPEKTIAIGSFIRSYINVELDSTIEIKPLNLLPDQGLYIDSLTLSIKIFGRTSGIGEIFELDCLKLSEELLSIFKGKIFCMKMAVPFLFMKKTLVLSVDDLALVPVGGNQSENSDRNDGINSGSSIVSWLKGGAGGFVQKNTVITFKKWNDSDQIRLVGQVTRKSASNLIGTNFEKLGIGGLDTQFSEIFRRAFISRNLPSDVVRKLGIQHVKGMMLHGPPGTGKTLIARQISKVLQGGDNAREPKVVSGPSILSKFVGESEKNVRELFQEAEAEQATAGDDSELHVIIFDEIDAICKKRGSTRDGTGVGDSVVNQLLAKIDGVDALNNVLLIGMTNRVDLIDSALLRPGRFEVLVEIGLPDEQGRVQILNIHTKKMRQGGYLDEDVDTTELAKETKNYSGAELEGVVRSALSFATARHLSMDDLSKLKDSETIVITNSDFKNALFDVRPAFGLQGEDELRTLCSNGIHEFSEVFSHLKSTLDALTVQSQTSIRTPLLSVLLHGEKGAGKTALVAMIAKESGFPFTKLISSDKMIGYGEQQKCSQIYSIFEDAYKSPSSLIVIDDIERLIDYVPIGPRFSNLVLQSLLVMINKPPPNKDRRLMVIATTAVPNLMEDLGLVSVFSICLAMPLLTTKQEVEVLLTKMMMEQVNPLEVELQDMNLIADECKKPISVKKLLNVIEMARQQGENEGTRLTFYTFMESLNRVGY